VKDVLGRVCLLCSAATSPGCPHPRTNQLREPCRVARAPLNANKQLRRLSPPSLSPPRVRLPARRPRALARGHLRGREIQRDRERARPQPSSRRPPPRRAIRTGLPESEPDAATATALTAANRHRGARRERRGGMSEAGEATTGGTTLPQAAADAPAAAPPDPAPKSPAASGAPQAPAPAALLAGSPGGDAAPGPAPASSAPAGGEDAEKKVLGESLPAARERRRARMDVDAGRAGTRGPALGSLGCGSGKQHVSSVGRRGH
jgi:hypothetical protein